MSNPMPKPVLVAIGGHPDNQSYNQALLEAWVRGARAAGADVRVHSVGDLDFDPILRRGYHEVQELEPDLRRLQRDIEAASHVAVFTPLWWGSVPAALKGLFDRVLLPGWAFRASGGGLPERLLKGRSGRMVLTMDSPRWWYWSVYRGSAHGSVVQATLKFIGLAPVRRTVLYGVGHADDAKRQRWLERLEREGGADARSAARAAGRLPAPVRYESRPGLKS